MSLGCARCGDCCNPVKIDHGDWLAAVAQARRWTADDIDPEYAGNWADRVFLASRLRPVGVVGNQVHLVCANWDGEHDRCRDYDNRPPLCRRFPHYGSDTPDGSICELRCSFLLDLPPGERPEGARPLIPLTVVSCSSRTAARRRTS